MYEMQIKSDFQTGANLIVRIPEEEIDKKALYTIMADPPDFVLPFCHREIDGEIEFTYQIGNRSKLTYLSGSRSPSEYADLWFAILQPLLDCEDWFMTPYSFVLQPAHLYWDKNAKSISFVYIPSIRASSDYDDLKSMVTEIAKSNHVTDINLENKVVWAIQDFKPNQFLNVVKNSINRNLKTSAPQPAPVQMPKQEAKPITEPSGEEIPKQPAKKHKSEQKPNPYGISVAAPKKADDIAINFPLNGKKIKEEKPKEKKLKEDKAKGSIFGAKKEKKAKPEQKPKKREAIWGKKALAQKEIIQGAAAMPNQGELMSKQSFLSSYIAPIDVDIVASDMTQIDIRESAGAKFRYIGSGSHPRVIEVGITDGGIFTIGRFDASLGTKQSSFEFDRKTRAVSRRHAAVERDGNGYNIVDLSSAAGTFINSQKLPANAPFKLKDGNHISFGNLGADYIWEE